MPEQIKINAHIMKELYEILYKESTHTEAMIRVLVSFKRNLVQQGVSDSSLSLIHSYCDSLISLMEMVENSLTILQDNASKISETFSDTDLGLASGYGVTGTSGGSYEQFKINKTNEALRSSYD
jgi:hypothetical protein